MFRAAAFAAVTTALVLTSGIASADSRRNAEMAPQQAATELEDQVGWYDWQDEQLDEVSGVADKTGRTVDIREVGPTDQSLAIDSAAADSMAEKGMPAGDQGLWSRLSGAVGAVFGVQSQNEAAN